MDSTPVLGALRVMNRLERVTETLRAALNAVATIGQQDGAHGLHCLATVADPLAPPQVVHLEAKQILRRLRNQ